MRVLRSVQELDEVIQATVALTASHETLRAAFDGLRLEPAIARGDPHSDDYQRGQLALYRDLSERSVQRNARRVEPDPWLIAEAFRRFDLAPGSTVLELGAGSGSTAAQLVASGFEVIAVEADPGLCELIRQREFGAVEVVNDDLSYLSRVKSPVDAVLFAGSLQSAPDHRPVFRALEGALRPGGRALFVGEPISPAFPVPWGLRLEGSALWSMRQHGRLELGFQERYFIEALARSGWAARKHETPRSEGGFYEATRRKVWSYRYSGAAPQLSSQTGTKTASTLRVKSARPEFFMYGPFATLPAGRWVASLTLAGLSSVRPLGICTMDVHSGGQTFASRELELNRLSDDPVVLPFELSKVESAVEIRLFSRGPVDVEIVQLHIHPAP